MLKALSICLFSFIAVVSCENHDHVSRSADAQDVLPSGMSGGTLEKHGEFFGKASDTTMEGVTILPVTHHGGPVMMGTVHVYYIFYGFWENHPAPSILTDFMNNLSGSSYHRIQTTYSDVMGARLSDQVQLSGVLYDNYSQGILISSRAVEKIISTAIIRQQLPFDPNGVYFILTSGDVSFTGFCVNFCALHSYFGMNGQRLKYAFVGDPVRCPRACQFQQHGPNGDSGADAMASVIAHELSEAITDPELTAWYDKNGLENADKCAWMYGKTYPSKNGAMANTKLGNRDYLLQENWVNDQRGYCATKYP